MRYFKQVLSLLSANACLALPCAANPPQIDATLPAYNTYHVAPFTLEQGGLAADLIDYLNQKFSNKYQLRLQLIPRERLKLTVLQDGNFKGIVLFLNPAFLPSLDQKKYHWTSAIMDDANLVISAANKKIIYSGIDSLKNLRFGAVLGHNYSGINEQETKDIKRENVADESANLKKLLTGRIDFTIMPASTYYYLVKHDSSLNGMENHFFVSPQPHAMFERYLFSAVRDSEFNKNLDAVVSQMPNDPIWHAILLKYGIKSAVKN